jgi:muconolactone delta-isomerase
VQKKQTMKKLMIDIVLEGIDDETRIKLLPREQEIIKEWEDNGTLLASYIKSETAGIYMVLMAEDKIDADKMLSTLPYYPYMKIEMIALR